MPPSVAVPVTLSTSWLPAAVPPMSARSAPPLISRLPLTVSVPAVPAPPGWMRPRLVSVLAPVPRRNVPLPRMTPPTPLVVSRSNESVRPAGMSSTPDWLTGPAIDSEPLPRLTVPVLTKLPLQLLLTRFSVCAPGAVLFRVPALVNTGNTQHSMLTGVALLVLRLTTPPAWLTNTGDGEPPPDRPKTRLSSPPRFKVPALSHRRSSRTLNAPPVVLRLMLLVEPAAVISVPLPSSAASLPLAVKLPVTVTVPPPRRMGSVPVSVRLPSVVAVAELRPSAALLTVTELGRLSAPSVASRSSAPPVRDSDDTLRSLPALRLAVPADTLTLARPSEPVARMVAEPVPPLDRLATFRLPPALTVNVVLLPVTVVAGSAVVGPPALMARLVTVLAEPTASVAPPLGATASVRVPVANSSPVPAAMT